GMRNFGSRWPANTTAPPMTTSTRGKRSLSLLSMSPATRLMAASTSPAVDIGSEFSRNAQASLVSSISALSLLQILGEGPADLRVLHPQLDRRLQVAQLAAAVVALAADVHRQHALFLQQRRDRVGELDLPPASRLDRRQALENRRRQHVAADHRHA